MGMERLRLESLRAFFDLDAVIRRQPVEVLHVAAGPANFGACGNGLAYSEENLLGVLRGEACAGLQDLHLPPLRGLEDDHRADRVAIALDAVQPEGQNVSETSRFAAQN